MIRLLIVEDENIFRNTLQNYICWEDEGYLLVGFAENGEEALSLLKQTQPQVIITDIAMPIMNGVDFIRETKFKFPDIRIIVISGFDDFTYVRDAMKYGADDYILKSDLTKETLLKKLKEISSLISHNTPIPYFIELHQFLENLINQYYTNTAFITDQLKKYHLNINIEKKLFLIQTFTMSTEIEKIDNELQMIYKTLKNLIPSQLPVVMFPTKKNCFILGEYDCLEQIVPYLHYLSADMVNTFLGIYAPIDSVLDLKMIRQKMSVIQNYFFYNPEKNIFTYDSNRSFDQTASDNTFYLFRSIEIDTISDSLSLLEQYFNKCKTEKNVEPYNLKKICEHFIFSLIYCYEKNNLLIESIENKKMEYFKTLSKAYSLEHLHQELLSIVEEIQQAVVTNEKKGSLKLAINHFLENNYGRDIKLQDLAKHVCVSYHHISKIFNSLYNESFNIYLNQIRIEHAKILLKNTDKSIGEIAEQVGFTDQNYFGKTFKKFTGLTPRDFRYKNN